MIQKEMTLQMFHEQLHEVKYGNDTALNVIMSMFLLKCNNLSEEFFEKVFSDYDELQEFLFLIPQNFEYDELVKRVVSEVFRSRAFHKSFIKKFLRHFSGNPKVVGYYLDFERDRIQKFNHGSFT